MFPEAPRKIASYLLEHISSNFIEVKKDERIIFGKRFRIPFKDLMEITKKSMDDLTTKYCSSCNSIITNKKKKGNEFICRKCGSTITSDNSFMSCPKCKIIMEKFRDESVCKCGSKNYYRKFNALSIIEVDTILISSRHLYRMPYSLHEKSSLVSLPIDPKNVLSFEKEMANPQRLELSKTRFLDRGNAVKGEAKKLLEKAFEFSAEKEKEHTKKDDRNYEVLTEAMPEKFFPPCIKNILKGLEDGRKRSLFILTNFLISAGWSYEEIKELLEKWNKKNSEPLREVLILGQIRYHKQRKKKILPPNCQNKMYYVDMRICTPDNLCKKIKNPVNYSVVKAKYSDKKKH